MRFAHCLECVVDFICVSRPELAKLQAQYNGSALCRLQHLALEDGIRLNSTAPQRAKAWARCPSAARAIFPRPRRVMEDVPVTLASGRARLVTSPEPKGSETANMTTGIFLVAALAAIDAWVTTAAITSTSRRTSSVASSAPLKLSMREPVVDDNVLTFDITKLLQSLQKCFVARL